MLITILKLSNKQQKDKCQWTFHYRYIIAGGTFEGWIRYINELTIVNTIGRDNQSLSE